MVGGFWKKGMKREDRGEKRGLWEGSCPELTGDRASAEQPGDGFVSPGSLGAALEPANHLFRAIIGPGNAHISIESHIALPVTRSAQDQIAEFFQWRVFSFRWCTPARRGFPQAV